MSVFVFLANLDSVSIPAAIKYPACLPAWPAAEVLAANPVHSVVLLFSIVETFELLFFAARLDCPWLFSDLQGERPAVEADGVLYDRSGGACGRRGPKLVPVLRTGLQQPGNADVREVRKECCLIQLSRLRIEAGKYEDGAMTLVMFLRDAARKVVCTCFSSDFDRMPQPSFRDFPLMYRPTPPSENLLFCPLFFSS